MYPCLGLELLGNCAYNPANPANIYLSAGEAISALGFILAVQQLLKPIYVFRLRTRFVSLPILYGAIFLAAFCAIVAMLVPNLPISRNGPWGYPVFWEFLSASTFVIAYGSLATAIIWPVKAKPSRIADFAQGGAALLSAASERDHIDFATDLSHSIPTLIEAAHSIEGLRDTSAFFDFANRDRLKQAGYAWSFLRIIADPLFCKTLVTRLPWRVANLLRQISEEKLHARAAEQFVRELARQAILSDESMLEREISYHGFGAAPILSQSLFDDAFIVSVYDPLHSFRFGAGEKTTSSILKRFNDAAARCLRTEIASGSIFESQVSFSVRDFYRNAFMSAWNIREDKDHDSNLVFELTQGIENARKIAQELIEKQAPDLNSYLYLPTSNVFRHDMLEELVETIYEGLSSISNKFEGWDDVFWMMAQFVLSEIFPQFGTSPNGFDPFQQRLAIKLVNKLQNNMDGFYPAISRVLLACFGPFEHKVNPPNRTAFVLLKEAIYFELQKLPTLAQKKPDKLRDFFPDNVTYDVVTNELTHTYRGGDQIVTRLSDLKLNGVDLVAKGNLKNAVTADAMKPIINLLRQRSLQQPAGSNRVRSRWVFLGGRRGQTGKPKS